MSAAAVSPWRSGGGTALLVGPAVVFLLLFFIYPFGYGFWLSFTPNEGGWLANYEKFFSDEHLWRTLIITFQLRRRSWYQRWMTAILVIPITLGTVLIAEGMLTYLGPKGWLSQFLQLAHIYDGPIRLTHNFIGVVISLVISGFPFAFLLILSYVTGIDPVLARAAATLGAGPFAQFRQIYLPLLAPGLATTFCLAFVQAFSVFPSAVLVGAPSGPTRVISLAAYEAAFEQYDYSMASTVAMIMGFSQLIVVVAVLALRHAFYRGPASGAKG